MADWWKIEPTSLTPEEQAEKQIDYWNVFYASAGGRHVLFDILRETHNKEPGRTSDASLALIKLYHYIRGSCGIDEEKAIDAEASATKEAGE